MTHFGELIGQPGASAPLKELQRESSVEPERAAAVAKEARLIDLPYHLQPKHSAEGEPPDVVSR